jgi:GNAT superfamily N-acetyltransferase
METEPGIQIRKAVDSDIEFVTETIVQAEKGNGDSISYCKLFNISEEEFRTVLRKILAEKIGNFEFSLENFKIAEADGISIAAYGAWLEGREGISSGLLKISALRSFLGKENIAHYKLFVPVADEISIRRQAGTIQFESIYIVEEYRGKNIGKKLVQALLQDLTAKHPGVERAQVQLIKQNTVSLHAHQKYGFKITDEKTSLNPEILNLYSGNTRVLMEIKLR